MKLISLLAYLSLQGIIIALAVSLLAFVTFSVLTTISSILDSHKYGEHSTFVTSILVVICVVLWWATPIWILCKTWKEYTRRQALRKKARESEENDGGSDNGSN